MRYGGFYRHIYQEVDGNGFTIKKNNEKYGTYNTLADALYERDRLIRVDWDVDKWCELPDTINGYIHIDLPPFEHTNASYIALDKEHWEVRGKGSGYRYYGTYYDEDEAKYVAMVYDGRIVHYTDKYRVQRKIDGKTVYFGKYNTIEEARARVEELNENGWKK